MSNFRAMTRATEYGLANGIPEKYRDWQPATWVDENKGVDIYFKYRVIFDDGFSYAVRFHNLIETKNRFECDEQMPLPKIAVKNKLSKYFNKLKSYCRRFI